MEIKKTSDQQILTLNMLVYGDPGVGKTSFIGTAENVLIADTESGLLALRDQNVPYVSIKKWEDIEELYKYLRDEKHEYKVVAIDTMTELTKKLVQEFEEGKKFVNGTGGLTLQGWGEVIKKVRNLVRAFRDLNISVIFTAHAQFESTGETSKMRIPMLQGKLPMELAGMVDIVGYMTVVGSEENKKHVIKTSASEDYYAKDRTEVSGGIMKPDFEEIKQAVFENKQFAWTKKMRKKQYDLQKQFEKDLKEKTGVQCDAEIAENERCEEMLSDAEVKFCASTSSQKMFCYKHQAKSQ